MSFTKLWMTSKVGVLKKCTLLLSHSCCGSGIGSTLVEWPGLGLLLKLHSYSSRSWGKVQSRYTLEGPSSRTAQSLGWHVKALEGQEASLPFQVKLCKAPNYAQNMHLTSPQSIQEQDGHYSDFTTGRGYTVLLTVPMSDRWQSSLEFNLGLVWSTSRAIIQTSPVWW